MGDFTMTSATVACVVHFNQAGDANYNAVAEVTNTVTATDAAPTSLVYSTNPAIYSKGTAIADNIPSHGGGEVTSYGVSPALPAGLSLS